MKKVLILSTIMALTLQSVYGWGAKGHKLIAKHAVMLLPAEMKDFRQLSDYLIAESNQPDRRKEYLKDEGPKHYINIDFYKEFNQARMVEKRDSLAKIYGSRVVAEHGVLPWILEDTYHQLVTALKKKEKEKTKEMMRDLCHYLADAHQPMHTTSNYNGQLSGQLDIHERYESMMLDEHLYELDNASPACGKIKKIADPAHFFFQTIYTANARGPILLAADKAAVLQSNGNYDSLYYAILWFKTKEVTEEALQEASLSLASIYFTAWLEAGKPKFNSLK